MKKTAATAVLTLFASAILLSACADGDMWGHHHDHDRDRDRDHPEHFSAVQGQAGGPIAPALANGR